MTPLHKAGAVVLLLLACWIGGCVQGQDQKQGEWDAAKVAEADGQAKALEAAAKEIAKIEVTQQTIVQKVRRETIEKPVYRDCLVPSSGVGLLNQAIDGQAEPTGAD